MATRPQGECFHRSGYLVVIVRNQSKVDSDWSEFIAENPRLTNLLNVNGRKGAVWGKEVKEMSDNGERIDTVRASRAGHTFHERWAARRALQLVFPNDDMFAIAVEGISSTETASPGAPAEEVADLVIYYGRGDNFQTCERLETIQFKYKLREDAVTAVYLKKTIEKFSDTILGYEKEFPAAEVDKKASFIFVTNSEFSESLWDAIKSIIDSTTPSTSGAVIQARNLKEWCANRGLSDASRLFSRIVFRAKEKSLAGQDNDLRRTLTDWSPGADSEAKVRILGLQDLILKKAGPSGQGKNLIRREDVLDALNCEPEDLFPAEPRFIDVGDVVERAEISMISDLIKESDLPVLVQAEGGVGKTVFVQSLASRMECEFEIVVFDCFGGGSYRSDNYARHLPRIGLVQIINELASRTLCDPMLPGSDDSRKIIIAACKRLAQAAKAIRAQSNKLGLLLIIDAADNAQIEADYRHEESFPKRLLAAMDESPIDGVKMLLTARPHRKDRIIDRATVTEVELGPFTDLEAREFLSARKPSASVIEIATALIRSGRNARVLDYLVKTWDTNPLREASTETITVPEIIGQRCRKIISDLYIAGWPDSEITEFFVALSLLPPPIPLEELASALGWSVVQVKTAASDLAPMLEVTSHGAIFRDEPAETYVRETYSECSDAQKAIADRLVASQATSAYAAEALPHFLVVIKDSDRAFALADSTSFPATAQSEFGRRRLTLARLRAAFRLAVTDDDLDRVLGLCMRLGQAATANMRGDEFIRRSPALAIVLGDTDSYRRLLADRSGWRGARSARLTVAHRFAGNTEEAHIQCDSTIRWINWHNAQSLDETSHDPVGPESGDFSAVLFQHVVEGEFTTVDRNLSNWSSRFSLSVSKELLQLLELYDQVNRTTILLGFVSFITSKECISLALKLQLLSRPLTLSKTQVKLLANAIVTSGSAIDDEAQGSPMDSEMASSGYIANSALTTLLYSSRAAAAAMIRQAPVTRLSAYDYGERYGHSRAWGPILRVCVVAWAAGRPLAYSDLIPIDVKITKQARAVTNRIELMTFLKTLRVPVSGGGRKKGIKAKFSDRECEDISNGIEIARELTASIESAVLSRKSLSGTSVTDFLEVWRKYLRVRTDRRSENASDLLARAVGLGCINILLNHVLDISVQQAMELIRMISSGQFYFSDKVVLLRQLAQRPVLHELAGEFAQHIAEQIGKDDNIGQRGESYMELAGSLMHMSLDEAHDYYRQGLAQLDQLGGENYELINSLLHFASVQQGGFLTPASGQRLMNLCQTIVRNEPRKFGWTLFSRAAAKSIGLPAITKLVRWHDQDVADMSYGLPQVACFLAKDKEFDTRRAAFILMICEDHGWWDWRSGDGVADLLRLSEHEYQRRIFQVTVAKLRTEYPFGGWPSLWDSYLETGKQFTNVITFEEKEELEALSAEAKHKQDEFNNRNSTSPSLLASKMSSKNQGLINSLVAKVVVDCDPTSASSIDVSLKMIAAEENLSYLSRDQFIAGLSAACPYPSRLAFLFAICEATELNFTKSLEMLIQYVASWSTSSSHLISNTKALVERLFECKGAELFDSKYSNITRDIGQLSDFCSDKHFVLTLVLRKVAADEVDLDGDEWLLLAAALCDVTSGQSGLESFELLLSGPTARIADEIGEGPLHFEQEVSGREEVFIADAIWHLLGNEDAYVRWTVARSLSTLVELGLIDELSLLLDRFDVREVVGLSSSERKLSFQNSQQWLLMGLARATLRYGHAMVALQPKLLALARRSDIHIINKVHISRCLKNIVGGGGSDESLEALIKEIDFPSCGVIVSDIYPSVVASTSNFHFDYEFAKHDINILSRLFNVAQAVVEDAIATEITRLWPEASSMGYFTGRERHLIYQGDRYELYREHVQRHALLSAATTLSKTMPVAVRSYETGYGSPWLEWRDRYDVTFDDGSWLSDRKNTVPQQAKEVFLGEKIGHQETLQDQQTMLKNLGLVNTPAGNVFPLYGRWTSPDGVIVSITSALTKREGAIGRCAAFSKRSTHDLWLPEFWDQGNYDQHNRQKSPFDPLVWAPDSDSLGIDVGDGIAAMGPGKRPRLGIALTKNLKLVSELYSSDWLTENGHLALRSQVWGSWKPDPENNRLHNNDDGEILWAMTDWLADTLPSIKQQLVLTVRLWKPESSRDYNPSNGVKSVIVGLRDDDGSLRFWPSKKASELGY